jgi:starch synthase (maltosyl-transferring)
VEFEVHVSSKLVLDVPLPKTTEPPARIQIQRVTPQVDCGRYAVKRTAGDRIDVTARIFRDGHELLGAAVRFKPAGSTRWSEAPLEALGNDEWAGTFEVDDRLGTWCYRVEAWVDRVASFQHELRRKVDAGQKDLGGELSEGSVLLGVEKLTVEEALAAPAGDRSEKTWSQTYEVDVDRELARFGSWYELFPRSWGGFDGVRAVLPQLAKLGFDVVYLPPIHPIGTSNRKGRNNSLEAGPKDPGSPWAIGSAEGGHDAIHPELGTGAQFDKLVSEAKKHGIEIALDFAIQCSPDHPWLKEHPEWFYRRPDGTLKYAENPPKKYQDIYNVNFDSESWRELWDALLAVVRFWEWLLHEVRTSHPDVVFLAEAFTRPAMLRGLAQIGFHQSYTYFTWRNTREELEDYLTELSQETSDYLRPNLFVNTPDILTEYLQFGGPAAYKIRAAIAATAAPTWGVYSGYELFEDVARPGSEENIDNEKYEYRPRDYAAAESEGRSLTPYLKQLNRIRSEHPALRQLRNLDVHWSDDPSILVYSKHLDGSYIRSGRSDAIIVVANVDPHAVRETTVHLDLTRLGLGADATFEVTDLITKEKFTWGADNYVRLDPFKEPVHILGVDFGKRAGRS